MERIRRYAVSFITFSYVHNLLITTLIILLYVHNLISEDIVYGNVIFSLAISLLHLVLSFSLASYIEMPYKL